MRPSLSAFVLALAFSGCATVAGSADLHRESLRFERAAAPLTGWKKLVTPDYELVTDLNDAETQRAGQLISQSLAGLRAMFGTARVIERRPVRIIAMADELEFEKLFGVGIGGLAGVIDGVSTIFLYGVPNKWFQRSSARLEQKDSVLQHELAHAVLHHYIPVQPSWFAEGMAQYLETFRWADPQTVILGEPNLEAMRKYAMVRSLTVKDLLSDRKTSGREWVGEYGLAWGLVHYAINHEPQRFTELMARLVDGDADAFLHSFGEDTGRLDVAIHQHVKTGQYQVLRLPVPLTPTVSARLEPAERPAVLATFGARDSH